MTLRNAKGKAVERRAPANGTVPPRRSLNSGRRPREYMTPKEVELLRKARRERGRYAHRDVTMILIAYRPGLRPTEVCTLRWDQVDVGTELLHVRRVKNGVTSVHPTGGGEIRDLRRLKREEVESCHVFLTERRAPISPADFRKTLALIGKRGSSRSLSIRISYDTRAGINFRMPARIRERSSITLGTKNCKHTVRYTELSAERFKSFWED